MTFTKYYYTIRHLILLKSQKHVDFNKIAHIFGIFYTILWRPQMFQKKNSHSGNGVVQQPENRRQLDCVKNYLKRRGYFWDRKAQDLNIYRILKKEYY